MLHTILVPIDDSEHARGVIPFVATLARRSAARVILLEAVEDDAVLNHAETVLQRVQDDLERLGVAQVNSAACTAEPVATIMDTVQSIQVDLVVMATSRSSNVDRWLNGSIADDVIRHVGVPVLVLPAATVKPWPDNTRLSILVALDGSTIAERALEPAAALARVLDADILLTRIVGEAANMPGSLGTTYLGDVAKRLRAQGMVVRTRLAGGHPSTAIAQVAEEEGVNLIAMATHGRTGLARLALGSVAAATLQHAELPLLLVNVAAPTRQLRAAASAPGGR